MTSFNFNIRRALHEEVPAGEETPPAATTPKVMNVTQEQLDKIITDRMKKERAERATERQGYIERLEAIQTSGMTAEEKATLENQIEELRAQNLTKDQLAARAKEKADKEWETKYSQRDAEANAWKQNHDKLVVKQSIARGATLHKALPQALEFLESSLSPKARLVPVNGEDGQPTGDFEARVKLPSKDAKGKVVVLDLSVEDAIKTMRETPEQYGMLFEGAASGGTGANGGRQLSKPNIDDMDLESYRTNVKPTLK